MADSTSTIKASGGDYSSNAAWISDKRTETGTQEGIVYGGFDSGIITFNLPNTGTMYLHGLNGGSHPGYLPGGAFSTNWPHVIRDTSSFAYQFVTDNCIIERLAFHMTHQSDAAFWNTGQNCRLNGNLFYWDTGAQTGSYFVHDVAGSNTSTGKRITNNVHISSHSSTGLTYWSFLRTTSTFEAISHNTYYDETSGTSGRTFAVRGSAATNTITNLYNNAMLTYSGISNNGTITNRDNNATADTTGDTGHTSLLATDVLYSPTTGDVRPMEGDNLDQAGTNRTGETDLDIDVARVTRSTTPNIGAHENFGAEPAAGWPISYPRIWNG